MTVYGTPASFASNLINGCWLDCIRISVLLRWHTLMPGHNGLFALRFPISLTCLYTLGHLGFYLRRFDLSAITQLTSQSLIEYSHLITSLICRDRVKVRVIINPFGHHGPGHSHHLVCHGTHRSIGVPPVLQACYPATQAIIFIFCRAHR